MRITAERMRHRDRRFASGAAKPTFAGADDVYSVRRLEPAGTFQVKHYPRESGGRACCNLTVLVSAADVAEAGTRGVDPGCVTLARVQRAIEAKHAKGV